MAGDKNAALYSSSTDNWSTPQDFYELICAEFGFEVDVCAGDDNHKCPIYFTKQTNGLAQAWHKIRTALGLIPRAFWMNPPYGDAEQPCPTNCKKKKCLGRLAMLVTKLPGVKKAFEMLEGSPALQAIFDAALGGREHHNEVYVPGIADWMQKAYEESLLGATVVCLVPARVDSGWYHDWVHGKADEVRIIKGRLFFGGAPDSAPFPNILVIYRPGNEFAERTTRYTVQKQPPKVKKARAAKNAEPIEEVEDREEEAVLA